MCLFIIPEVVIQYYFYQDKYTNFRNTLTFCWLAGLVAGVDCYAMAAANLVGFSFGVEGLRMILENITFWLILKLYIVFVIYVIVLRLIARTRNTDSNKNIDKIA